MNRADSLNITILGIDDNPYDRESIIKIIERYGVKNYKIFSNKVDFIAALTEGIHVIIIDHLLEDGSYGLEIVELVKDLNVWSFVIGFSAISDDEVIIKYMNADCNRWVKKRVDNSHLPDLEKFMIYGLRRAEELIGIFREMKDRQEKFNGEQI